jgi:hypothetical protein
LYGDSGIDLGTQGRNLFYDYLRTAIRLNMPYSRMVEEVLTARAMTNWFSGPANFLVKFHVDDATGNQVAHEDTLDEIAIGTAKILLGLNLECISCHNGAGHLNQINLWLTRQKREEVWREGAFFGNLNIYRVPPRRQEFTLVETGPGYDAQAMPVPPRKGYDVTAESFVRMPRWKADVNPTFILTGDRPQQGEDPQRAFARMLIADPQFARATVNWIWAELMGVGIVDPPWDFDLDRQDPSKPPPKPWGVQPTHPELLETLAKDFREHNFDLRYLIKLITKSSAYQLSPVFAGEWKDEYARYFARRFVRRLSAEELFDAISQVTGIFPEFRIQGTDIKVKYVMQTRSTEDLPGEISRFLGTFGQSNRTRSTKSLQGNMVQASLMLNSKLVKDKVKAMPGSRIYKLLNQEPELTNEQLVEELFLSILSRFPTGAEKQLALSEIREYRTQGVENLMWALINKWDFVFSY